MQPFIFTGQENTPCESMWTFHACFSEIMRDSPQRRGEFAPYVDEVSQWCTERFGPPGVKQPWDYSRMGVFYFEDPIMGFEFKMRWC